MRKRPGEQSSGFLVTFEKIICFFKILFVPLPQASERNTLNLYTMATLVSINQIPRGSTHEMGEEVFTPGFGYYHIHISTKGVRRYFELTGWYTGKHFFSTSIKADREDAIRAIKDIADDLVNRYRKED